MVRQNIQNQSWVLSNREWKLNPFVALKSSSFLRSQPASHISLHKQVKLLHTRFKRRNAIFRLNCLQLTAVTNKRFNKALLKREILLSILLHLKELKYRFFAHSFELLKSPSSEERILINNSHFYVDRELVSFFFHNSLFPFYVRERVVQNSES